MAAPVKDSMAVVLGVVTAMILFAANRAESRKEEYRGGVMTWNCSYLPVSGT